MFFEMDAPRPAVVAIDLHRGHLDPDVATMPLEPARAQRVVDENRRFLQACRKAQIPVIHVVTTYRDVAEIRMNPFWRTRAHDPNSTRGKVEEHNLMGSPGCEIIPDLWDPSYDLTVTTKKRYDGFVATDLEFLLRSHDVNLVMVTGVNTNSCVLATAISACNRDFAVVVVEDCVDSMDGQDLHSASLACLRAAFAWVASSQAVLSAIIRSEIEE